MSNIAKLRDRMKNHGLTKSAGISSMPKDPNEQTGSIPGTLDTSAGKLNVPDAARSNANTDGGGYRDHSNGADVGKDVKAPESVGPAMQQGTLGDLPHKQAVANSVQGLGNMKRLVLARKEAAAAPAGEAGATKNAGAAAAPAPGKEEKPAAPGEAGASKTAGKAPVIAGNLMPQELAFKIATAVMSTEEGQALALDQLTRIEGQEMADGIIKSAHALRNNYNQNLAAEQDFNVKMAHAVGTHTQQLTAIMDGLSANSPTDFHNVIKTATGLAAFAAEVNHPLAVEVFKRGMADGAAMAQDMAPPEAGGGGQSPEDLMAQLQQLAAEMPPEQFAALVQQMVESGEIPPEVAEQILSELGAAQSAPPDQAMKNAGCDPEWMQSIGVNLKVEQAA